MTTCSTGTGSPTSGYGKSEITNQPPSSRAALTRRVAASKQVDASDVDGALVQRAHGALPDAALPAITTTSADSSACAVVRTISRS